ncbi:hypothetical protein L211DRAFT_822034 [Terfezia boudieri ATCC MYA-4762]|uniref:S-adenosyl-L-methionine-dependent methyltransferase n=1 Tax=Terfezia boudieri ATCC MYA-4762 TaxID=1051890 RepID=A0A3N4LZC5_9PEZI|nr:hypothetical protein L211DRAFT_822034 [Terfezia boudieri ATCC MYA-4762]
MTLQTFLALLGDPLDGTNNDTLYEDTFAVLAHRPPPKNLGFIDHTSSSLSVTVNGHDFAINQSPQLLKSQRAGGTTGAVVWSLTPLLASFLTSPTNPLAVHGILTPQATILELGSGVSSILALSFAVAPQYLRPARIVLSDQEYVLKIARQNVEDNLHAAGQPGSVSPLILDLISLDWERDSLHHHPAFSQGSGMGHISLVVVVDCIYNESLIPHLIETCVDACSTTSTSFNTVHSSLLNSESGTLVLVALELRSPDVLDCFLEQFTMYFKVWRVPDSLVSKELRTGADAEGETVGSGYAVYCGTLMGNVNQAKR